MFVVEIRAVRKRGEIQRAKEGECMYKKYNEEFCFSCRQEGFLGLFGLVVSGSIKDAASSSFFVEIVDIRSKRF